MKLAVVGLDSAYWPMAFADAARKVGAELVLACDLWRRKAEVTSQIGMTPEAYCERYKVRLVHSLDAVAADAQACFVCTRNTRMTKVVVDLLGRGKPVYVAKPVAVNTGDMAAILKALKDSGLVCAAGQTARSSYVIRTACRLIREGHVGEVLSVRVAHQHGCFARWNKNWWYTDPKEGDAFDWLGWYAIDGVLALTGSRIKRITGAARRHLANFDDMPDLIRGTAVLEDGRIATMEIHFTVGNWKVGWAEIEVVGTKGVLRSIGPRNDIVLLCDGGPKTFPLDKGEEPLPLEVRSWLNAIGGRGAPVFSLKQAAHIVHTACAWKKAARQATWVNVGNA